MKTETEFRDDVYQKLERARAARRKRNRALLLCLPLLLAAVACTAVFWPGNGLRVLSAGAAAPNYPKAFDPSELFAQERLSQSSPIDPAFQESMNRFGLETANALAVSPGENAVYCPPSLYYALSLAGTGAAGQTQEELYRLLGASSTESLSENCRKLFSWLYMQSDDSKLTVANSVWLSKEGSFEPDFLNRAENDFFASVFPVDFNDATAEKMAQWVSDNTGGLLSPKFQFDPSTLLELLNTVYYKDTWSTPFKGATRTESFRTVDGDVDADFMHDGGYGSALETEQYRCAARNFVSGGRMVFFLPEEGIPPQQLLADPDGLLDSLRLLQDGEETRFVDWSVPKFSYEVEYDLIDPLKAMGVETAFDPRNADFSGMTNIPAFIGTVRQGVKISLDENGIEAAAFTEIALTGTGAAEEPEPWEMKLDRPFLYCVLSPDGTLLFVGVCENPAA